MEKILYLGERNRTGGVREYSTVGFMKNNVNKIKKEN